MIIEKTEPTYTLKCSQREVDLLASLLGKCAFNWMTKDGALLSAMHMLLVDYGASQYIPILKEELNTALYLNLEDKE